MCSIKHKGSQPTSSFYFQPLTSRQALLKDLRKKETRQSLRRVQPPIIKPPFMGKRHNSAAENTRTYTNGHQTSNSRKERPKTVELGGLDKNSSKTLPKVEPKIHAGPPKFRRKNSADNLLANNSPRISPVSAKKMFNLKKVEVNNNNDSEDDDGYEEVAAISEVKPYAVRDIAPADKLTGINGRRVGPERPAPPPKVVMTMRPSPPIVSPRAPRSHTLSGVVMEQKLGQAPPAAIQRPTKPPPKVPQSPPKVPQSPPKVPQSPPKVPQSPRRNKKEGREVS